MGKNGDKKKRYNGRYEKPTPIKIPLLIKIGAIIILLAILITPFAAILWPF